MKRLLLLSALVASTAWAHHGWIEYNTDKLLTLTGTIEASGYEQPHGFVELNTPDKRWHVVLAPPGRMDNRGLQKAMLAKGSTATVVGYAHRSKPGEMRAERITIAGKTTELR